MIFALPRSDVKPSPERFDRPYRDGRVFCTISRHFVPGYYQMSLSGQVLRA
jgi:hypothetical protein